MTFNTVLIDFAIASFFILIGQLIRSKVKFIQSSFIPASLLAGLMGLVVGPALLGWAPLSEFMGSYAGTLVVVVFASVGLGGVAFSKNEFKKDVKRLGSHACYKLFMMTVQFVVPLIVGILLISKLFPTINYSFGLTLAAGFYGGHGTAAAVGESLTKLGWAEGMDIAMTMATAGILTGIFGGLIFIKYATEKGYTQYVKSFGSISDDYRTGLIQPQNRKPMGMETTSPISLNTIAFHLSFLLVPAGLGYLVNKQIELHLGWDIPTFTVAFILALIMFFALGGIKRDKIYKYIDIDFISSLGSAATDYVVFFGVASIKIAVIIEYAVPLLILTITGIILVSVGLMYFGPRMNDESWFERSIFVYGYATGVYAIGLTLLRIVDPQMKSKTITDTAVLGAFMTPLEIFAWAAGPAMLLSGRHWAFIGVFAAFMAASLLLPRFFGWWYSKEPKKGRNPA